ncbi:hypothetical protein [Neobacillus cucumis]|uniref:hypothetical protein n=1 Tax=Neobacillus cucumis TaxID=1740721 RepID=UPI001962A0C1|nr:hypothetical protein [Neobacillus cucumis]MBM7651752.1 hypothetical protein [Neobacillus cucumis]
MSLRLANKKEETGCIVCGGHLGKNNKICEDCHPFWDKAAMVIKDKGRKEVKFDNDEKQNKILFAQEMRKKWIEKKDTHFLCPYTMLPMQLKNPITKKEADEDEKKKELRNGFKYLRFSPDRISSSDLYVPGNVEVCTYIGNIMKNDLDVTAFESVLTERIKDKITIDKDEVLVKLLLRPLLDFYSKVDLSEQQLEDHSTIIDEIKRTIDEKKNN